MPHNKQHNKMKPKKTMSYAKGGKVKMTGMAKVHKGEVVLTSKQAKQIKKLFN